MDSGAETPELYKCPMCEFVSNNQSDVQRHVDRLHNGDIK